MVNELTQEPFLLTISCRGMDSSVIYYINSSFVGKFSIIWMFKKVGTKNLLILERNVRTW